MLVLRNEDGEIRAFRNVCRHRGSMLLTGEGTCKQAIRCRYHGWTYKLDGTLIGLPEVRAFGAGPRQERARPHARARRGDVRARVREPRPRCRAAGRPASATCPSASSATTSPRSCRSTPHRGEQPANWKVDRSTTTSTATTSRSRIRRWSACSTTSATTADIHDHYVWFEAPHRENPTDNRLVRLYSRLVQPMPGLGPGGPARLALRVHLPEHDPRHLSRPDEHLADPADRRRFAPTTTTSATGRFRTARARASCSGSTCA